MSFQPSPPQLEVSPTLTTVPSAAECAPPEIKCTIEHQVTTSKSLSKSLGGRKGRHFLFGMSKPLVGLIATTVVATTGSVAWLFTEWLSIPGLQQQIDTLEQQVNQLAYENDRYSQLNSQLNETTTEYKLLNNQLNDSTTELHQLNEKLNQSNSVFEDLNAELHDQNQIYAALNEDLNETKQELSSINEDLWTLVDFLEDTSTSLQHNLEALIEHLADQITLNQVLVLETMRNTYQQRIQNWDCGYRDYFLTEDFIQSNTHPIGDLLPEVLDYVEQRLLLDLCLDQEDLNLYLETTVNSLDEVTSNQLVQGTSRYTSLAMDYYFPNFDSNEGVSAEEWAAASYRCSNLNRLFLWS